MNCQHISNTKSYILRIRNEEVDQQKPPQWRYVLLNTDTEIRQGFTSLDKLFIALYKEISGDKSETDVT